MSIYKKWADKEYPLALRVAATLCGGTIFVLLIPLFFLHFGPALDQQLGVQITPVNLVWRIAGSIFLLIGIFFAVWSIGDQITRGKGTPIPAMATQKLLVHGPFQYSRNPMGFGTSLAYLGLSFYMASLSMVVFSLISRGYSSCTSSWLRKRNWSSDSGRATANTCASPPFLFQRSIELSRPLLISLNRIASEKGCLAKVSKDKDRNPADK